MSLILFRPSPTGIKCRIIKGEKYNVIVIQSNQAATINSLAPTFEKLSRLKKKKRILVRVIMRKTIPSRESKTFKLLIMMFLFFIESIKIRNI
jgi:hypothetical protein